MNEPVSGSLIVGDWTVEPDLGRLRRDNIEVRLEPRQMDVLICLADRRGEVVSADALVGEIWQGTVVGDDAVYQCVSRLREALGDDSHNPTYIETIPKRGYRLIAPVRFIDARKGVTGAVALASGMASARKKAVALTGLLVLVLLVALYQFFGLNRAPPAPRQSIAVLPFTNLSPDSDQEFFSDGISEELLNVLAQVPGLRVAAQTSSFRFKGAGRDIQDIARQLNVAHVLEGSVRRGGTTVRITAQLIDAKTGFHLWAATYDRELDDIFAVQDEISAAIVAALSDKIGLPLPAAPLLRHTANSAAYDEYLLGILEMSGRGGARLEAAKEHFERALALDPDYAPAHARLSITLGLLPQYNTSYTYAGIREIHAFHTRRAMAIAPNAPESLAAMGFHAWRNNGLLLEIRATFERVVELNPSFTDVLIWLANVSADLGDYQAQIDLYSQALRIDPLNALAVGNNANMLMDAGRFEESRALIGRLPRLGHLMHLSLSGRLAETRGLTSESMVLYLEELAIDRTSTYALNGLARELAFGLGLADEALSFDHGNWIVMIMNGRTEEAMRRAEGFGSNGFSIRKGQVLLLAGRPGEAVGFLNQAWDQTLAVATVDALGSTRLVHIGRARQMAGDKAGGKKALEAALAVISRRRAAGKSIANLDWTEGVARYFLGRKEAGLALVARALERGFMMYLMQPQYEPLTSDPAFAPILAAREAYAAAERKKFLPLVCNGGSPAPHIWTPKPETCEGYVEG